MDTTGPSFSQNGLGGFASKVYVAFDRHVIDM